MTRLLVAISLLLAPCVAHAASPEADYVAARNAYIETFSAVETWDDGIGQKHDDALRDLQKKLEGAMGPVAANGYSSVGKLTLDTLVASDEGYGLLDGLTYASADGKSALLVTTRPLFAYWLKEHENWWEDVENVPQEIDAALQSEIFYTQAISTDASVARYADIPIEKPAGAEFAFAMLASQSQDFTPVVPDKVLVSVATKERVFIVSATADPPVTSIDACDRIWQESEKKANVIFDQFTATGQEDDKLYDDYTKAQQEGAAAFHRCYAERAPAAPFFAALAKQVEGIAASLPR